MGILEETKEQLKHLRKSIRDRKDEIRALEAKMNREKITHTDYVAMMREKWFFRYPALKRVDTLVNDPKLCHQLNTLKSKLWSMQDEYRTVHTVYCLLRGRTMEQIEQRHRDHSCSSKWCFFCRTEGERKTNIDIYRKSYEERLIEEGIEGIAGTSV